MNSKTILWMLLGLVIAFALPLGLGALIALAQQVTPENFLWAIANAGANFRNHPSAGHSFLNDFWNPLAASDSA